MDFASFLNTVTASASVITLADLLLKSVGVLAAFLLLDLVIGRRLSSNSRHLLWLNALFCLAVLPWLPALISVAAIETSAPASLFEITVTPATAEATAGNLRGNWLLVLYAVPGVFLLVRMIAATLRLRAITRQSLPVTEPETQILLKTLKQKSGISRQVTLRVSQQIDSPLSFGLVRPHIILPVASAHWARPVTTDALLHELSHIRRLDWFTMLSAWVIASVYWINPLVWIALKRLDNEAENSCDTAVLHAGRSDTEYAESLMSVARACIHSNRKARQRKLMAQKMLDRNTLNTRIIRILEENPMTTSEHMNRARSQIRKSAALLLLISAGLLTAISTTQIVSAQSQNRIDVEMRPVHQPVAVYPGIAAREGIEGWAQVRFTVTPTGTVDPQSVELVDAQPEEVFDASAIHAIKEFTFTPRIVDGEAVSVPNVQYVFRYVLEDEE